jgi:xanthine dehydrogenase accessory factor
MQSRFTLTESAAGAEGLNCGGTVEMLIEPIGPEEVGILELYRAALTALESREETVMATLVRMTDAGQRSAAATGPVLGKGLVSWKGLRAGTGELQRDPTLRDHAVEEALAVLGQDVSTIARPARSGPDEARLFLETLNAPPTLYLFGGGHVSLSVARVARTAGFKVVVIDDRPAFASEERFPEADRTLVLPMEDSVAGLPIDSGSYVVAVTRGHQHDEPVIEQAVSTSAAYIGMIGSRRKVAIMWERLRERGVTSEQLARVHAPIGLDIGADSPGEIAVSIVAQMIETRRKRGG